MSEQPTGPRHGHQPRVGHQRKRPEIIAGKAVEIPAALWHQEQAIRAELADVKRRLTNVTRQLNRRLGNAEYGLIGGKPVVRRVELSTGGSYAPVNHRALLEPVEQGPS